MRILSLFIATFALALAGCGTLSKIDKQELVMVGASVLIIGAVAARQSKGGVPPQPGEFPAPSYPYPIPPR